MTVHFRSDRRRWVYGFEYKGERHKGYCLDAKGQPVTSKRAAEQAEARERTRVEVAPKLARAADLTLATIVAALQPEWEADKTNWANTQVYVREFVRYMGPDRAVATISEAHLDDYKIFLLRQPVMIWTGGSTRKPTDPGAARFWKPSGKTRGILTVNRYLHVVRAIFERAYKTRDPLTNERVIAELPKITQHKKPKRKARPVPQAVLTKVLPMLPQHVREALIATLLFGFRRGEIYTLLIRDVDFEAGGVRLEHERVKDDEDAFLPGSEKAMGFMAELVAQARARGTNHLITWRQAKKDGAEAGDPWLTVKSPKRAWRTAMNSIEAAFGKRWRWHDIRAAYISHIANTTSPLAAQKLARHSEYRTTQAYVLAEEGVLRAAADAVSAKAFGVIEGGKSPPESPPDAKPKTKKTANSLI